ncbi:MAG: 2'-5' RNA ligase [Alphaproteobacteria bacterium]|jgi:2'-5' RNA ligase
MISWGQYYKKGDNLLNIALTFSDRDNQALGLVAKKLDLLVPSVYRTGENSIPHITIAHIDGDKNNAEKRWQVLMGRGFKLEYDVIIKCFCVDAPWEERVYTSFLMEEFGKYAKLQDAVLQAFQEKEVHSGLGADFLPHITLSCHLDLAKVRKIKSIKPPFKRTKAYLTIGSRDSYGRMEKIFFRHEIEG